MPEIAKDLGVWGQSLRNWLRQSEIAQGTREGLSSTEREQLQEENRRLRREDKVL